MKVISFNHPLSCGIDAEAERVASPELRGGRPIRNKHFNLASVGSHHLSFQFNVWVLWFHTADVVNILKLHGS